MTPEQEQIDELKKEVAELRYIVSLLLSDNQRIVDLIAQQQLS